MEVLRGQRLVGWGRVLTGICSQSVSKTRRPDYESLRILNRSGQGRRRRRSVVKGHNGGRLCQTNGKDG